VLAIALNFHAGEQPFSFVAPQITARLGVASSTVHGVLWYPVDAGVAEKPQSVGDPGNPLFEAGNAAAGAPIAASPKRLPLILLSHGIGGSARQMAWLGTELARAGFLAVAIDHPGDTSNGETTVQGLTLRWLQPRELSMALDAILADPTFGARVDQTRVGAAGFSLGGYTVIGIVGGRADLAALDAFCAAHPQAAGNCVAPEFPDLAAQKEALRKTDPDYAHALASSGGSVTDPRVRAAYAMAPAVGESVTLESLRGISVPVRITYGSSDEAVVPEQNALRYSNAIPGATVLMIAGAGHYAFLDTCTSSGMKTLAAICVDAPGIDRDSVHARVANDVVAFFDRALNH
jgi:predicted dienelactone hydrolase